jgi:hypothetical protein
VPSVVQFLEYCVYETYRYVGRRYCCDVKVIESLPNCLLGKKLYIYILRNAQKFVAGNLKFLSIEWKIV